MRACVQLQISLWVIKEDYSTLVSISNTKITFSTLQNIMRLIHEHPLSTWKVLYICSVRKIVSFYFSVQFSDIELPQDTLLKQ